MGSAMAGRNPIQDRGRERRGIILEAAAQRFADQGYSDASLRQIAASAGCTLGSIYFFFATKDDLAQALLLEQEERVDATIRAAHAEHSGFQGVIWASRAVTDLMTADIIVRAGMRLGRDLAMIPRAGNDTYNKWVERNQSAIDLSQQTGEVRPEIDPKIVAQTLILLFLGTDVVAATYKEITDTQLLLHNALSIVIDSITTPSTTKVFHAILNRALPIT